MRDAALICGLLLMFYVTVCLYPFAVIDTDWSEERARNEAKRRLLSGKCSEWEAGIIRGKLDWRRNAAVATARKGMT